MANTVLEVSNLSKKFADLVAVDGISFSVKEGEIVGLLGPNGAGKTTTIQMILGIIEPTAGEIKVLGKKMPDEKVEILKQVNFSSTYVRFPWALTVWEVLYVYALLYEVNKPQVEIKRLLKLLEIYDLKDQTFGFLSSGEATRVGLAKALISHPKILFLDEPTASLDPDIADQVRTLLKKIRHEEKVTTFLTSHNMAEVEELCDRVIFLDSGRILVEDTPEGLAAKIALSRVEMMVIDGQKRLLSLCQKMGWKVNVEGRYVTIEIKEDRIGELLTALVNEGIFYKEISIAKPTLEDYFLSVARTKSP